MEIEALETEIVSASTLKEKLAKIDEAKAEFQEAIRYGEILKAIKEFEGFNELFIKKFTEDEPKRLTQALTNPTLYKREQAQNMSDMLTSVRHFKQFISFVEQDASSAVMQLEELESHREQIIAEQS